jgi:hypothetical protein
MSMVVDMGATMFFFLYIYVLAEIINIWYNTYRNTYQISRYVSFVEKVYRSTPSLTPLSTIVQLYRGGVYTIKYGGIT